MLKHHMHLKWTQICTHGSVLLHFNGSFLHVLPHFTQTQMLNVKNANYIDFQQPHIFAA